jgi:hypothetical protein
MVDHRVVVRRLVLSPAWPRLSGLVCVHKCMCVKLTHTKKGFSPSVWRELPSDAELASALARPFRLSLKEID